MTDFSRLQGYIHDYFPEPKYSPQDIRDWAMDNVPAWGVMSDNQKDDIIEDWEDFIVEPVKGWFKGASGYFISKVKKFLGKLF